VKRSLIWLVFVLSAFPAAIPTSFFGIHVGNFPGQAPEFPLLSPVQIGAFRSLGNRNQQWGSSGGGLHICNSTTVNCLADPVTYTSLDTITNLAIWDATMAGLYSAGVQDNVIYTVEGVPNWAQTSNRLAFSCSGTELPKGCAPPDQMNPNGTCSGSTAGNNNLCTVLDVFIHQFAVHVNDPTYLMTHAHIKYWEPHNEWDRDPTILGTTTGDIETSATFAQMLRTTEDMRCIIKGVGTIHNYPSAGSSTQCSTLLAAYGWVAADPTAQILTPSVAGPAKMQRNVLLNFLYCNQSPMNDLGSSTSCSWSGGANWGSAAVDVVNWHMYWQKAQPESVPSQYQILTAAMTAQGDGSKPVIDSESGAGHETAPNIWLDDYSQAGGMIREFALYASLGVTAIYHMSYAVQGDGNLVDSTGSTLTVIGNAWITMYGWLNGFTLSSACSNVGTVYTCSGTLANGQLAELVWDSQFGPGGTKAPSNCSTAATPIVCGTTSYTVPGPYTGNWITADGVSHSYSSAVTIGAVPILLEQAPPSNITITTNPLNLSS
jgi:hypothetical protein